MWSAKRSLYKFKEYHLQPLPLYRTPLRNIRTIRILGRAARDCYLHTKPNTTHTEVLTMPHRLNRNTHASMGAAPDLPRSDHTSGHKKSKNQPRIDQSSDTHAERPLFDNSSPQRVGGNAARIESSDDDADGDISNGDAADPDDESDEDGEGDAFAPSDRATEGNGDQAGHINGDNFDGESTRDREQSLGTRAFKGQTTITEAKLAVGDSDDDIYNGVDLISDSEEDEPNVEQLEERNIIESEEADHLNTAPSNFETSDVWEGFELDDISHGDVPFFDEQYYRTDSNILDFGTQLFQSANVFDELPSPPAPSPSLRRVRFKEPISNDSDMDSDNGDINVLFSPVVPSGGDWDLGGPHLDHESDDASSIGSASGYETDYGDTTDEEDVPASAIKRPQSLLRQPSLSSLEFETQMPATPKSKCPSNLPQTPAGYRRGPRMGTWIVDSTNSRGVIASGGENAKIRYTRIPSKTTAMSTPVANRNTSTANASPIVSQQPLASAPDDNSIDSNAFSNQASIYQYNDPVLGPGSDMVAASAPLPTNHSQQSSLSLSFAASSVFFPMDAMKDVGVFYEDDELDGDDDGDDDDALLNIDDFIDFGDDSSEDGDPAEGGDVTLTSPVTTEDPDPFRLKTPSPGGSDDLMKHLDRNKHTVSAFRRGDFHHQSQQRSRHGNLALNSYALKGGRQAAVNASMELQKKRKMSGGFGHRPSLGAPAPKRKMIHHR